MIHIDGDYYLAADTNGYSLIERRISGPDSKEPGKEYFAPLNSYHSTVSAALSALVRRIQRKLVESTDYELREAIEAFNSVERRIGDVLRELISEGVAGKETSV